MLGKYLEKVREKSPLIHCITNYVTVNDVANVIIACGGRPIMSDEPEDVEDITSICKGLTINIGTLNKNSIEGMLRAGKKANEINNVVLLDPVGAGASRLRTETALRLINELKIDIICGNISEIKTLATGIGSTKGVDADVSELITEENLQEAIEFIKKLSKHLGAVIVISGEIDLVSDGEKCYAIRNGEAEMGEITGTGCQLSGIITAFASVHRDNLTEAVAAAVCMEGLAGEIGKENLRGNEGNSTYRNRIIDAVYNMSGEILQRRAKYELY